MDRLRRWRAIRAVRAGSDLRYTTIRNQGLYPVTGSFFETVLSAPGLLLVDQRSSGTYWRRRGSAFYRMGELTSHGMGGLERRKADLLFRCAIAQTTNFQRTVLFYHKIRKNRMVFLKKQLKLLGEKQKGGRSQTCRFSKLMPDRVLPETVPAEQRRGCGPLRR